MKKYVLVGGPLCNQVREAKFCSHINAAIFSNEKGNYRYVIHEPSEEILRQTTDPSKDYLFYDPTHKLVP